MMERLKGWWSAFRSNRNPLTVFILIAVGLFVLWNGAFFVAAYFPQSCRACHYMDPYVDQWQASSHSNVTCIKCHSFSPVFITVTTLKYATGLYNPRPRADVRDESCLAKECHAGRIEKGKVRVGSIQFDHQDHLTKLKRGERLRCTSCHSAVVQGEHIAKGSHTVVDKGVCFLCHFKGISPGQALGGCQACHGTPTKVVEHGGFMFSHESYLKIGVPCMQCHTRSSEGDGKVADSHCYECHVGRLEKKGDVLAIHRTHVTARSIQCFKCHERIQHGTVELVKTFEVRCDACHKMQHGYQKEMYMGTGAKGVPDTPSRMFSAQVSCDGCHTRAVEALESGVSFPGERRLEPERKSCVACHGKGYDLMMDDWVRHSRGLVSEMERVVAAGMSAVGVGTAKGKLGDARGLVRDARENLKFLRAGRGAHNIEYALKILQTGHEQVATAYKLAGVPGGPPKPAILASPTAYCATLCHSSFQPKDKVFFREMEIQFPHALHVKDVGIECSKCHSPEKHKMRIVTKSECMACHHESRDIDCAHCHGPQKALYEGKVKAHGTEARPDVMAEAGTKCVECHDLKKGAQTVLSVKAKCEECHDPSYGKMLLEWKQEITKKENAIAVALEEAKEYVARSKKAGRDVSRDEELVAQADANYQAVTAGRGTHNIKLSRELLRVAQANLDKVLAGRRGK
ncbi:MAG: hypothetical protein AB1346_07215 [Thermodesulfobacteriota bacterium]